MNTETRRFWRVFYYLFKNTVCLPKRRRETADIFSNKIDIVIKLYIIRLNLLSAQEVML